MHAREQNSAKYREVDLATATGLRTELETVVHIHEGPSEATYKELWANLPGGAVSSPFQGVDLIEGIDTHFIKQTGDQFVIVELKDQLNSKPLLLLPVTLKKIGPVRVARMADFGIADQVGPVLANDCLGMEIDWLAKLAQVLSQLPQIDVIDFEKLPAFLDDGCPNPLFHHPEAKVSEAMYKLDLSGSDCCQDWQKKSVYKEARAKYRKLVKNGGEFVHAQTAKERLELLDVLYSQRRERFARLGIRDAADKDEVIGLFRSLAAAEASDGSLQFFALRNGNDFAAICCGFRNGTSFCGSMISIGDEHWRRYSPGITLICKVIEWCRDQNVRRFCFGTGLQAYKQRFGGSQEQFKRLVLPLNPLGKAYALTMQYYREGRQMAKDLIYRPD